ncbi:hypothetical protein E2F48_13940 [Arthrobacter crusticola]|uniref:Uncharacterized protein n=1 Tax=Arthrobacter crusticola TaxID=2547960 RepID=A0A4R5TUX5_9MICC|nr:hypothetical protein [Arthrobacter crusticola]TDK24884.1 hypothetical protein E2F48_13940 [Arthrobacter crusticola]
MPSRNGFIAVVLKTALLLAVMGAVHALTNVPWSAYRIWPALVVVGFLLAVDLSRWRSGRRLRGAQSQVESLLRARSDAVPGAPRAWKPGLATPGRGRLYFQPHGRLDGSDDGELMSLTVHAVGPERDITVSEGFFRMGPTWRVVELSMPGGGVELAGPAHDLRKALAVLRRSVGAGGDTPAT